MNLITTRIQIELQNTNQRVDLDLSNDIDIPIDFQFFDFKNPATNYISSSYTITLKGTKNNNIYFNHIYELNGKLTFNPKIKTRCWVYQNNVEVFKGYLFLLRIIRKNKNRLKFEDVDYEVQLIRDNPNEIFNSKETLSVLNFDKYNHIFDYDKVYKSWFGDIYKDGSPAKSFEFSPLRNIFDNIDDDNGFVRLNFNTDVSEDLYIGETILINCTINYISGFQKIKNIDYNNNSITIHYPTQYLVGSLVGDGYIYSITFHGEGYVYPMLDLALGINKKNHENYKYTNSTGDLIAGHNYIIQTFESGDDFTSSGSPNNTPGQMFIYNGVIPTWSNGSVIVETTIDNWRVNEFRPAIFLYGIFKDIMKYFNLEYESNILESQDFKRLVIPYSFGDSFVAQNAGDNLNFSSEINTPEKLYYNLYPFNSNFAKSRFDVYKFRFYSINQIYTEPLGGVHGYFDGGGYNPNAGIHAYTNWGGGFCVKGARYKVVNAGTIDSYYYYANGRNNLSLLVKGFIDTNFPPLNVGDEFVAVNRLCSTWADVKLQMLTPIASHHVIPYDASYNLDYQTTYKPIKEIQLDTFPSDINLSGGIYTMPSSWSSAYINFYFNAILTHEIDDLPNDFGGTSISTSYPDGDAIYNAPGVNGFITDFSVDDNGTTNDLPYTNNINYQNDSLKFNSNWVEFQKSVDNGTTWVTMKALYANDSTNPLYSFSIWNNTIVQGQCKIKLNPGDKVRMVLKVGAKVIALRTDGKPCVGTSAGGGNGAVCMAVTISNAKFWGNVDTVNIDENSTTEYNFNSIVPKISIGDFIRALVKKFNLVFQWDDKKQKYVIETKKDYFTNEIIDWSNKIDYNENIEIDTISDFAHKNYLFRDNEGNDYVNETHQIVTGKLYGSKNITVENDISTDTYEITTVFQPAVNVGAGLNYSYSDKIILTTYQKSNYEYQPASILTLGFYCLRGSEYDFNLYSTQNFGITDIRLETDSQSLAKIYPTVTSNDNHIYPLIDINFGFPVQEFYDMPTHNNFLYNLFYEDDLKNITDPKSKVVRLTLKLNSTDIQNLDFRKKYFIEGYFFRLNKIMAYRPNGTGLTECEFIGIID